MQVCDRICLLHTVVNVFRLLRLLAVRTPPLQTMLPLGQTLRRSYGTSLVFKARSVLKVVKRFSTQPNVNTDFNALVEVMFV